MAFDTNPFRNKYRIWCSVTDKYLIRHTAPNGDRTYEWTKRFHHGMNFPEIELSSLPSVLMGTYVRQYPPEDTTTFTFEVVGAAILATGFPLRDFYLIPIELGFGEVERVL